MLRLNSTGEFTRNILVTSYENATRILRGSYEETDPVEFSL